MIISEKYKYVFIQNDATASSTIGNELCLNYNGENILRKHSTYKEFLKYKGDKAKDYFVFCGIRNPLDQLVTFYYKRLIRGDLPNGPDSSFYDFFNYFAKFKIIFPGYLSKKDHKRINYVIRYENLQEDFSKVLAKLGIDQIRPLQDCSDPTPLKKGYLNEYQTQEIRETAFLYLNNVMKDLGYSFPLDWKLDRISRCKIIINNSKIIINNYKMMIVNILSWFKSKLNNV